MELKLKNKVAVITGSARGIGFSIAEEMAKEGAKIVISDLDQKDCEKASQLLGKKYKVFSLPVRCDVSCPKEVEHLVGQTLKEFGRLDILVNNAGIVRQAPLLEKTEDDWDKTIDINLKSVFLCSRAAARPMMKQKSGKIISITSIAGLVGFEGISDYCASKGGIIALTKELALELAGHHINVNAIAPGVIRTKMTEAMLKDEKTRAGLMALTPLGRPGEPEEIGKAAVFLASDDSSFITGHTLVVDGGWLAR